MARQILFHYHIFKNAGTTVDWSLRRSFGDRFETFDSASPRGTLLPDDVLGWVRDRPNVVAFASHQARFPVPGDGTVELRPIIFFRHPITRVASVYAFERRQRKDTPGAVKARSCDFETYVRWRLEKPAATVLTNHQVAYCTPYDPAQGGIKGRRRADLAEALDCLRACAVVGVVEEMDRSLVLAEHCLGREFVDLDLSHAPQNISRHTDLPLERQVEQVADQLGTRVMSELLERNALDLEMHEIATRQLETQVAAVSDFDDRLADFRQRCRAHGAATVTTILHGLKRAAGAGLHGRPEAGSPNQVDV
ncbi:MAG: hypothetical protein ACYSU7_18350 [Planctomycetota bacterium]|jgi:hypothetical protein